MRRMYNSVADVRTSDCLELTRRLHKCITDIAKKLDEQKSCALSIVDIFTPSGESLRVKLKDYCVRLIFKDPIGHARKTEELLWRKGFYDVVYAAKKLRKGNVWSEAEKALLSIHLAVGVGFYHHLILRLQLEYGLDINGAVDFAFKHDETRSSHGKSKASQSKPDAEEVKRCVMRLIHRSLVCLGDLARYKLELDPCWDPMIAKRYYKMAIAIDPNIGMPHNQLGTIASNKNYGLDAVYHYMRCVLCTEPFEGAEGNLRRAIVTQSVCLDDKPCAQHCVSRLLSLLQLWDCEIINSDRINQECQDLLNDIESCLSMERIAEDKSKSIENEDSAEVYLQNCKNEEANYLTDDMIFKIVTICLMSICRLKSKESTEVQGVVAITLAVLSQLVQFTVTKLQELILDTTLPGTEDSAISSANSNIVENNNEQKDTGPMIENNSDKSTKYRETSTKESNEFIDSNEDKKSFDSEKENAENNGNVYNNNHNNNNNNHTRKVREKPKNLLTKLRRRKRKSSSDSDISDIEHAAIVSSSDEANSDMSEMEDDILSEENALSEDALSEDITDDEGMCTNINADTPLVDNLNGDEGDGEQKSERTTDDSASVAPLQNGEQNVSDTQVEVRTSEKDSTINSGSAVTLTSVDSNSAYDESSGSSSTTVYAAQLKKQSLEPEQFLNILTKKEILASIKVCCDWLKSNQVVIRMCAKSSRILLKRITILLNLINIDTTLLLKNWNEDTTILTHTEKLKEFVKVIPLPEDTDLRGLNLLEGAHKRLDWKILHKHKMSKKEEMLLRVLKLIEFGHYLTSVEDLGIKYDDTKNLFLINDLNKSVVKKGDRMYNKDLESEHPRGKLMRHMGKLWLSAEVRALESRLRSRVMTPYLVPDHEALAKHTPALKRLVYSKRFIIIIPIVVVSALDEIKRISGQAREAIRWLEAQWRRGSRFLLAQNPHERLPLPLIKRPRPKDKEAWLFFQIIECCHYFNVTHQPKVDLNGDIETPVVTLLTGYSQEETKTLTFSPDGLAKTAGVNFEHIESFDINWKASNESHG